MRADLDVLGVVEIRGLLAFLGRRRAALPAGPRRERVDAAVRALGVLLSATAPGHEEGLAVLRQLLAALRLEAELPGALEAKPCPRACPDRLALLVVDGELVRAGCATCDSPMGEARADRSGLPDDVLAVLPPRAERRSEAA